MKIAYQFLQGTPVFGIHCAKWFIQKQYFGIHSKRTRYRHALLLTAGKLCGLVAFKAFKPNLGHIGLGYVFYFFFGQIFPDLLYTKDDILLSRKPGEQGVVLKHYPPLGPRASDFFSVNEELAAGGPLKAAKYGKQSAFTTTACPQHTYELAGIYAQVYILKRHATIAGILKANVLQFYLPH